MIEYRKGNLLEAKVDVIAHGCNCRKTMGSGVAKQIAQAMPKVRSADRRLHLSPKKRLGKIDIVDVSDYPFPCSFVINAYTQLNFGKGGRMVSYRAISDCFERIYEFVNENGHSLAIPKIGAKRGGGNWNEIERRINEIFKERELFCYYL